MPSSRAFALAKTALFTIVVPGTVAFYVPWWILARAEASDALPIGAMRWLGAPLVVAGTLVYLRCAWDFATVGLGTPAPIDPPKALVVNGLYRHVRNPMYVGVLAITLGEGLLFASRALVAYWATAFLFFHLFVTLYEEPALASRFGESYARYRANVRRWWPRIRAWEGEAEGVASEVKGSGDGRGG